VVRLRSGVSPHGCTALSQCTVITYINDLGLPLQIGRGRQALRFSCFSLRLREHSLWYSDYKVETINFFLSSYPLCYITALLPEMTSLFRRYRWSTPVKVNKLNIWYADDGTLVGQFRRLPRRSRTLGRPNYCFFLVSHKTSMWWQTMDCGRLRMFFDCRLDVDDIGLALPGIVLVGSPFGSDA
jgi:hypothetical protein